MLLTLAFALSAPLGSTPVGVPPGPGFAWQHLPGVGFGWVQTTPAAPVVTASKFAPVVFQIPPISPAVPSACPNGRCPYVR